MRSRRRRLPWLLSLPLILGGSFTAHAVGSHWLAPVAASADADGREITQRADHGYMTLVPLILGVATAIALVCLVIGLRRTMRPRRTPGVPPLWFLVLPPLAFAIQELAERVLHAEAIPFNPIHEPALLAGLALQVPFGLLAYVMGRALLGVGRNLARVLAGEAALALAPRASVGLPPALAIPPRVPVLALGHSVRGPPLDLLI